MVVVLQNVHLPLEGLDIMAAEARVDGHSFIDRLKDEWESGENRFDKSGEVLLGGFVGNKLVAIGGINQCPYSPEPKIGRLRHLYVLAAFRNRGIASALVEALVKSAIGNFQSVRLRTGNEVAAALYEKHGFGDTTDFNATHERYLP